MPDDDCHRAFNMGIGMIVGCAPDDAGRVMAMLQAAGEARAVVIGKIVAGNPGVLYGKLT